MRWSWRLWPPVPWGGPERSRFRPGIAYTNRMIACRHDGTRDQLEALAALECPRCPGQPLAPYGPDDANLRICDCCPRVYQMPDNPKEPAMTYHPPEPTDEAAEVAPPRTTIAIRVPGPVRAYVDAVVAIDQVPTEWLRVLPTRERAIMRALLTVALGTLDEADAS